jgi:C-terminal processing protease CtpA/Prc
MLQIVTVLFCAVLLLPMQAQTAATEKKSRTVATSDVFNFDEESPGKMPTGWGGGPANTISVDDSVAHSGKNSVRMVRDFESRGSFSTISRKIPLSYSGESLELRGFLCTESVSGFAGLWMREDQDGAPVAFDNMQARELKGTTGWTEYSLKLPLRSDAQMLYIGVLVSGTGKVWADDLQLLVDGKPVSEAPRREHLVTALDRDHQFDSGSGIILKDLTSIQIDNLVMLGKVWGFLKYYHSIVTAGQKHWDYELFRIAPAVLTAADQAAAHVLLSKWIENLGPVKLCNPCVDLEQDALRRHPEGVSIRKSEGRADLDRKPILAADLELRPDLTWIRDEGLLGRQLSQSLILIEHNRVANQQFYVSLLPGVQNPSFEHESAYAQVKLPDAGFQLLALYRFWNIIEYWSPNRAIIGEDWGDVLRQFLPRVVLAKDRDEYQREVMALIAKAYDTHANLWSSLQVRPPTGNCRLPLNLRFLPDHGGENRVVITSLASTGGEATGLKPGDVVDALDGVPLSSLVASWSPYYADSNDAARLRDISRSMTNGECVDVKLGIRRGSEALQLTTRRLPAKDMTAISYTHDLPGDTFRLLSEDVAYLKLSSAKTADVDHYLEAASKTKGLIIDIRNYPSEFMVFALGSHFVEKPTAFARFTNGDLSNPGAFHWTSPEMLPPAEPHYAGQIVILVDEDSQSQAEFTAMAFRASPHATVVGSATAGADGNVSAFALPGGLHTMISGIGVFYPDKRPTQRIGIVPDRTVNPTIEGIRAGRDEVLEEGVRQILGAETTLEVIQRMIVKK